MDPLSFTGILGKIEYKINKILDLYLYRQRLQYKMD